MQRSKDVLHYIFDHVTPQTLRYLFGWLLDGLNISPKQFARVTSVRGIPSHAIKTTWVSSSQSVIEEYRNDCLCPLSTVVFFRNRLRLAHSRPRLSYLSLSGWGYQNEAQFRACLGSWWRFYKKERYVIYYVDSIKAPYITLICLTFRYLPLSERARHSRRVVIAGTPLLLRDSEETLNRQDIDLNDDHITESFNCTHSPSLLNIGSMTTEVINSFCEKFSIP